MQNINDKNTARTDLGVPLMLEADPNITIGRATVQQVYDQILPTQRGKRFAY